MILFATTFLALTQLAVLISATTLPQLATRQAPAPNTKSSPLEGLANLKQILTVTPALSMGSSRPFLEEPTMKSCKFRRLAYDTSGYQTRYPGKILDMTGGRADTLPSRHRLRDWTYDRCKRPRVSRQLVSPFSSRHEVHPHRYATFPSCSKYHIERSKDTSKVRWLSVSRSNASFGLFG